MAEDKNLFYYNVIKEFLVAHGQEDSFKVKDKSFKSYYYIDEFLMIYFCEYMNGHGSYIRTDTLFLIQHKTGEIIKKQGDYKELESIANRLSLVGRIKKLINI